MSEFTTTIDLGELGEQECNVEFDFYPAERTTRDEPGCSEEVEITSVMWAGFDLQPLFCLDTISQLEQEAFDYLDRQRDSALADKAEYQHDLREAA